jgi:uncharacterized Zn finger protein
VELLQGRLSKAVMQRVCHQTQGLFPAPKEIELSCSCPDWAGMCKHVAAVLYGIGARLDEQPELLFRLRKVDEKELITHVEKKLSSSVKSGQERKSSKVLASGDLAGMFGLDLGQEDAAPSSAAAPKPAKQARKKATAKKKRATGTKRNSMPSASR